jgi:hypothetical protein
MTTAHRLFDEAPPAITSATAEILQSAYDHSNRELFDGSLPDVVIVLHRKSHQYGYFAADRFSERSGQLRHHELARGRVRHEEPLPAARIENAICQTRKHRRSTVSN